MSFRDPRDPKGGHVVTGACGVDADASGVCGFPNNGRAQHEYVGIKGNKSADISAKLTLDCSKR